MRYLKIQNDGLLDIRLVALMGGTTKTKDEFKIGKFGTGLKYTLAFLFRNNLAFKIFVGDTEVSVTLDEEMIRDEKFEIICINGHRTSITTKMGEDWKAWMIVRELFCNALDEGGAYKAIATTTVGEYGKTTFYIQIDAQIQEVLKDWSKYFLLGQEPMFSNEYYAIYPGGESRRLYKNGVLIDEEENMKCLFSYDIKNAPLNELREYKGSYSYDISHALFSANESVARYFLENVTEEYMEGGDLSYDWYSSKWSKAFETVIGNAKLIHPKALKTIQDRGVNIDESTLIVVPEKLFQSLTKQFERVSALMIKSKIGEFYPDHSEAAENKIKQGLTILEACNYPMHSDLVFKFGFFADKRVMARIDIQEKIVYISNAFIQSSLHAICAMLIEENEHFLTGMMDITREFQQHFIDLYTRQLLASHKIEI